MSNQRRRQPVPSVTTAQLRAAALTAAHLNGCDCDPDVAITEQADGTYRAAISHDGWCRLLARRAWPWN